MRAIVCSALLAIGCSNDSIDEAALDAAASFDASTRPDAARPPWVWSLPAGFPEPPVPADNPMSTEKVALGRRLFYDTRLSRNGTQSCASCHVQVLAFTDGRARALGSTGQMHPRSAMSLANVAYADTLTWGNPLMTTLEHQALVPLFGDQPVELGQVDASDVNAMLASDATYSSLFAAAFPGDPIDLDHAVKALSSFERTIISGSAPYDRWIHGTDPSAVSASAQRGYALFNSDRVGCFHCHVGFDLSDHTTYAGKPFSDRPYHNNGLYNIDGEGGYPAPNTGVYSVTGIATDMGRFKVPTLRNVAVTAPYMHDGSVATLSDALDHYAAGGRTISSGPYAGNGSASPLKDPVIEGFSLSDTDRGDLLAFLSSLTDEDLLTRVDLSSPW